MTVAHDTSVTLTLNYCEALIQAGHAARAARLLASMTIQDASAPLIWRWEALKKQASERMGA